MSKFDIRKSIRATDHQFEQLRAEDPLRDLKEALDLICNFSDDHERWHIWAFLFVSLRPLIDAVELGNQVYALKQGSKMKNRVIKIYQRGYEGKHEEVSRLLQQFVPNERQLKKAEQQYRRWQINKGPAPSLCNVNFKIRCCLRAVADEILAPVICKPVREAPSPSTDFDCFISAREAAALTGLKLPEISKLCRAGGPIRFSKPAKNRLLVHAADLARYVLRHDQLS
jgi:hypothetical protein